LKIRKYLYLSVCTGNAGLTNFVRKFTMRSVLDFLSRELLTATAEYFCQHIAKVWLEG